MTNFNYTDLQSYSDFVNEAQDYINDIKDSMLGAFPDNDREVDLSAARRQAEGLLAKAEQLHYEIRRLAAMDQVRKEAEATCNCSNPFCQV